MLKTCISYWSLSHVLTNDFENFIIPSGKICLLYENQTGIGITEYVRFFENISENTEYAHNASLLKIIMIK